MAKSRTIYICEACSYESAKWMGKCPSCKAWNTFQETEIHKSDKETNQGLAQLSDQGPNGAIPIDEINAKEVPRLKSHDEEFNRVVGGGIMPGSITLIGGEPGIGKSTLLLQIALHFPQKVLYVSGEESLVQIKGRADRMKYSATNCLLLAETNTSKIFQEIKKQKVDLLVIDSIQTMQSPTVDALPGSMSQIRECAGEFQRFAKRHGIAVILIGHITKDGQLAGPKVLEHIVDTVLQFEGDQHHTHRILRSQKNRFGPAAELGIYEMQSSGLHAVTDPTSIMLSSQDGQREGVSTGCILEGIRPLLIETQTLVSPSYYGTPRRSSTGFDNRRLHMLIAVFEKRVQFPIGARDVFLNIAGGIKVTDPGADLAVIASFLSSCIEQFTMPQKAVFCGEIGLSGEVRPVSRILQRVVEAEKRGMTTFLTSAQHKKALSDYKGSLSVQLISHIRELID